MKGNVAGMSWKRKYSSFHLDIIKAAETLSEFSTRRKNNCGNTVVTFD
jgi:hypothetical protein